MSRAVLTVIGCLLAACAGKSEDAPQPPPPPPIPADAAVDGITTIGGYDPASGMHLDDDVPAGKPAGKKGARQGTPIGILLKSDPPGATVYVDGHHLGETPRYWSGVANGAEHEFAFTLPKYGLARYRFVPISSGTLHATLEPAPGAMLPDAGLAPRVAPALAPDAAVAPPPTVIAPEAPPPVFTPDAAP